MCLAGLSVGYRQGALQRWHLCSQSPAPQQPLIGSCGRTSGFPSGLLFLDDGTPQELDSYVHTSQLQALSAPKLHENPRCQPEASGGDVGELGTLQEKRLGMASMWQRSSFNAAASPESADEGPPDSHWHPVSCFKAEFHTLD